ncbi:lipocalin family protein [Zunongwangia profunda]|uniref:lipocalin family protein n=1 Tax=Zunongwangia profunda TaxID=398743 RepID=UPI0030DBCEA3
MKNTGVFFLLFSLILLSCNKQDPKEQIQFIEGYWEIDKVEVSPDSTITYSINDNIDYFEVKGNSGQRTKLSPQLDGSFKTTNSAEKIELKIEEDSLRIYYKTAFDNWKETVLKASPEELVIKSNQDKIYHYKHYTPKSIDTNEKE